MTREVIRQGGREPGTTPTVPSAVPHRTDILPAVEPLAPFDGPFAFRYTSTELYEENGRMHVRMRRTQLKDGRLRSEEAEGIVDRAACEQFVLQAQRQFWDQAFGLARLFLAPLLGPPRRRD